MGAELEKLGYRVTGMESNPEAWTTAPTSEPPRVS
jgi:hypothetical protein